MSEENKIETAFHNYFGVIFGEEITKKNNALGFVEWQTSAPTETSIIREKKITGASQNQGRGDMLARRLQLSHFPCQLIVK